MLRTVSHLFAERFARGVGGECHQRRIPIGFTPRFPEGKHERAARLSVHVDRAGLQRAQAVLVATELAVTSPDNPGPAGVRATGRLCYPSANRAVVALDHLWRRARWLQRRGLA